MAAKTAVKTPVTATPVTPPPAKTSAVKTRGILRPALCALALTLFCPALPAERESGSYMVPGSEGKRFIQRLFWPENEYASRFELIVERREAPETASGESYTGAYRTSTTEAMAEFSLPPGNYRYRVIAYNLLRQPEYASPWIAFTILPALQPELSGFTPRRFNARQGETLEIVLEGRNLVPGAEVRLERRGRFLAPRDYIPDPSGERAVLLYDAPDVALGNYTIRIINPGNLEASLPGFRMGTQTSFQALLAYAPILPVGGYIFRLFDDPLYPVGAEARVAWLPVYFFRGMVGVEAALGWSYLADRQNSAGLSAQFWELGLNVLYRQELGNYFAFKVHAGAGLGGIANLVFDYGSVQANPVQIFSPMIDLGGSLEWIINHFLYAELGVSGFFMLSPDTEALYLKPFIGVGWWY